MIFIARIDYYDDDKCTTITDKAVVDAPTFTEAASKIEAVFGNDLENFFLEAITDSTIVFIDDIAEAHIRENEYNHFC